MVYATLLRYHGEKDLRYEGVDLTFPSDGILVKNVTNSVCMSSWKALQAGPAHSRIPNNVATNPTTSGHEYSGIIVGVGEKWQDSFKPGQKFAIQPALLNPNLIIDGVKSDKAAPGYSFQECGGNATYSIIPAAVLDMGCFLVYEGPGYFPASLAEPVSTIVGAAHAQYHTKPESYTHEMGFKIDGNCALVGAGGPMGIEWIDFLINGSSGPKVLIVTDIDQARLDRAAVVHSPDKAAQKGVSLHYVNTAEGGLEEAVGKYANGGLDDAVVLAAVPGVFESVAPFMAFDGCINYFAGPKKKPFMAQIDLDAVHYNSLHVIGTSGGKLPDLRESLQLMAKGHLNPAGMVTHIAGFMEAKRIVETVPDLKGGKRLIYLEAPYLPEVAIDDLTEAAGELGGKRGDVLRGLAEKVKDGVWTVEAEEFLLEPKNINVFVSED